jgi:hypothetical protein
MLKHRMRLVWSILRTTWRFHVMCRQQGVSTLSTLDQELRRAYDTERQMDAWFDAMFEGLEARDVSIPLHQATVR